MTASSRFFAVALSALATCSTFAPTTVLAQEAKLKIATVDMQQLFKEYYRTNEAQQQINVERARIQKDNNEKLTSIRQIENDIQNLKKQIEDPSLSDQKKAQVYKDHQAKYQEGIQLDKERREFLGRKNQALNEKMVARMRSILEEISKLVQEHAKGENFDYVFDKSGMSTSQVPFLLYTKDATDITAVLLKDLNKDAPKDFKPGDAAEVTAPAGEESKPQGEAKPEGEAKPAN